MAQPRDPEPRPLRRSIISLLLPYAKGPRNYFRGEVNDAAELGVASALGFYLVAPHLKTSMHFVNKNHRATWAFGRAASITPAALVVFGTLSLCGVDYRQYGIGAYIPEAERIIHDHRGEETAEKWTRDGLVFGAIAGALTARPWSQVTLQRPLPIAVGTAILVGSAFNDASNLLSMTRKPSA